MSRQQEYQKRKIAQGLCSTCGKRPLYTKYKCEPCSKRISKEKAAVRLKRLHALRKKELNIIQEIRAKVLPFARIDPTFEYVKVAKIISVVARKFGMTTEAIRRKYNKKSLLGDKSILK
jgi:hypothetical protein